MIDMTASSQPHSSLARQAAWLNSSGGAPLGTLVLFTDDTRLPDPRPHLHKLPRGSAVILRSKGSIDEGFARAVLTAAHAHGLKLLIACDAALAHSIQADGVHLPGVQLYHLPALKLRYPKLLFSAACHNGRELGLAQTGKADAAFLSPLFQTRSHVGGASLPLMHARRLMRDAQLPLYGLGGINANTAQRLRAMPLCGVGVIDGLLDL